MSSTMIDGPARRYYRSLEGRWSGRFHFTVTNASVGGEAATLRRMAAISRLIGPATMATTLGAEGAGFRHTTRVTKWGATLYETSEVLELNADGRTFAMRGEQRATLGPSELYEATGEVDETATRATYRIPWAGVELIQRTAIVAAGLELSQETPWSRGHVRLRRATA
jgi:hypothetical protein